MNLDDRLQQGGMLLRELLYGPAKTKKTWWAAKAAEANFNVVLLDGDAGWHILNNIKPEARKRIQVLDFVDKQKDAVFCLALTEFLKTGKLWWDEERKVSAKLNPSSSVIYLDIERLTNQTVLIIDSWTALSWSLLFRYAKENSIDLTDPDKQEWDYYRWAGSLMTWVMKQLKTLPCHVIVIGHQTMYEKRSKDGKTIESQRQQIVSSSGNNAMTLPKDFSDILTFSVKKTMFKISTEAAEDADGGSRIVPPGVYDWNALQFADVCRYGSIPLPTEDNPYIDYSVPQVAAHSATHVQLGQAKPIQNAATAAPTVQGGVVPTKTTTLKIGLDK